MHKFVCCVKVLHRSHNYGCHGLDTCYVRGGICQHVAANIARYWRKSRVKIVEEEVPVSTSLPQK